MTTAEKKAAYTPGPWRISGAAEGAGITIEAKRSTLVAFVRDNQHPLTDVQEHEATANARLIAQAPAMADRLKLHIRDLRNLLWDLQDSGSDGWQSLADEIAATEQVLRDAGVEL